MVEGVGIEPTKAAQASEVTGADVRTGQRFASLPFPIGYPRTKLEADVDQDDGIRTREGRACQQNYQRLCPDLIGALSLLPLTAWIHPEKPSLNW